MRVMEEGGEEGEGGEEDDGEGDGEGMVRMMIRVMIRGLMRGMVRIRMREMMREGRRKRMMGDRNGWKKNTHSAHSARLGNRTANLKIFHAAHIDGSEVDLTQRDTQLQHLQFML